MKPLIWARVVLSPAAQRVLDTLDSVHHDRFWRVVEVIKNGPMDGPFVMQLGDGSVVRQMTGADTHVLYRLMVWPIGRVLGIVIIEIRDWTPWYHADDRA